MENLPLEWSDVENCLKDIPDFSPAQVKSFKPGVHFFKIRYAPGEIIMPKGTYSDFAGIQLQGQVDVYACTPGAKEEQTAAECWNQFGSVRHWLENWILNRTDRAAFDGQASESGSTGWSRVLAQRLRPRLRKLEGGLLGNDDSPAQADSDSAVWWSRCKRYLLRKLAGPLARRAYERALADPVTLGSAAENAYGKCLARVTVKDDEGKTRPVIDRFMGLTGALWNVPRSATLLARPDDDGKPCEFLLIKRSPLFEIQEQSQTFRDRMRERFVDEQLPALLGENRLFRNTFYDSDVISDKWPTLVSRLAGRSEQSRGSVRIRQFLDESVKQWLTSLGDELPDDRAQYQILSELNSLLKRSDFYAAEVWPTLDKETKELVQRGIKNLSQNETILLNHLLIETAQADIFRTNKGESEQEDKEKNKPSWPLRPPHFRHLLEKILGSSGGISFKHCKPGEVICAQDDNAVSLFLIVSGTVRVTKRPTATAKRDGEMLVNQLERHGYFGVFSEEGGENYSATVRAATDVNLVAFDRQAVRIMTDKYPLLAKKLQDERGRLAYRDKHLKQLDRLPPVDPPEEVATKLLVAGNLLRIDMDLCTRCDQCVRACAEAHDGVARFERANPDLRFGKWEVAAACVHCRDAPCQTTCPVGAITFLESGAVQIHRNRCIGCGQCVPACPFDVIEMCQATSPLDTASKKGAVANKCDLCLTDSHDPPCVVSCPYGAAQRGAPRELFPEIKSWAGALSPK